MTPADQQRVLTVVANFAKDIGAYERLLVSRGAFSDDPTAGKAKLAELTQDPSQVGAFRTPTLRNVAQTAPSMHTGRLKTLEEVIDFYNGGGGTIIPPAPVAGGPPPPTKDSLLVPLGLCDDEKSESPKLCPRFLGKRRPDLPRNIRPEICVLISMKARCSIWLGFDLCRHWAWSLSFFKRSPEFRGASPRGGFTGSALGCRRRSCWAPAESASGWAGAVFLTIALFLGASSAISQNVHHWLHPDSGNPTHHCAATTFGHHQVDCSDTAAPFLGFGTGILLTPPLSPHCITFSGLFTGAPTRAPPFSILA